MKKTTKIIIASIIAAIVLLGIGYAAISNITLNIGGTLEADPNQANFVVRFTGTPTVSNASKVTASIESDTSAKIDVKDLETVGESVTATYTVENASEDLSADLAVATTNSNEEYFTIKAELGKTSLVAKETTTVLVTATLTKAPITESVTATVDVELTAMPVEPGKEGTSDETDDSAELLGETTLASVTNANIGDYIDLGNDIIDGLNGTTGLTTDDWRILYKDGNTVYAILADYFPNSTTKADGTTYVAGAGLETNSTKPFSVLSNTSADVLLTGLTTEEYWNELANGISGATVTGTPTGELLMNSYNTKNGTNLVYTSNPTLDDETEDYDLYVPHSSAYNDCHRYCLANKGGVAGDLIYVLYYYGTVANSYYSDSNSGIRPVVALPSSTSAELVDGVWTVSK